MFFGAQALTGKWIKKNAAKKVVECDDLCFQQSLIFQQSFKIRLNVLNSIKWWIVAICVFSRVKFSSKVPK